MIRHFALAALCCVLASPALAQTAVGTGTGISGSNSESGAVAIGGGNANATGTGTGISSSNSNSASGSTAAGNVLNVAAAPANQNVTSHSTVSGTTTQNINSRVSGTQTVKSNPSLAMGLAAAGLETCLGSASGGLSLAGLGVVGGSTYTDEGCQARLDSRTLWSYGLKGAAVARLCSRADMWRAMPYECEKYWPAGVPYPAGIVVAQPRAQITLSASVTPGSMRVIDGRDGIEKDCLNYRAEKQKCMQWAGEPTRQPHRVAAVNPTVKPKPITTAKPKPKSVPLPSVITDGPKPKPEEPKAEDKKS